MFFKKNAEAKNQKQLIEALFEITRSNMSEIKFREITWDSEKPILRLKGLNETPDFTISFGIDKNNPARAHIMPDCDPSLGMHFEMTYNDFNEFSTEILAKPFIMMAVKDILEAFESIMLRLGVDCYLAYYEGDYGLLKLNPGNQVLFISGKDDLKIDIESIIEVYLVDYLEVPDMSAAILIQTKNDKTYLIALAQPEEFARKLEDIINDVRNIAPRMASYSYS
jgi:hypothetical protein